MSRAAQKILVADDEVAIVKFVSAHLRAYGFEVIAAADGLKAAAAIEAQNFDLAILDLLMPGMTGLDVLRLVREHSQTPVIMLSATGDPSTKIECLNGGADDYITKPFVPEELIARVRSVLRRAQHIDTTRSSITVGPLRVEFPKRRALVAGHEVSLTPTEYALLEELIIGAGRVLTHRHLLSKVWGPEYVDSREYLHVIVNRLRAKVESDPAKPQLIVNIPRVGYMLRTSS